MISSHTPIVPMPTGQVSSGYIHTGQLRRVLYGPYSLVGTSISYIVVIQTYSGELLETPSSRGK